MFYAARTCQRNTNTLCDCVTLGKLPSSSELHFHHLWSEHDNLIPSMRSQLLKLIQIIYAEYLVSSTWIKYPPPLPPPHWHHHLCLCLFWNILPWLPLQRAHPGVQAVVGVICLAAHPRAGVLMKIPIVMHNHEESRMKLLWEPLCD